MSSDYTRAVQFHLYQTLKFKSQAHEKPVYVQSMTSSLIALEALRLIETLGYKEKLMYLVKESKVLLKEEIEKEKESVS